MGEVHTIALSAEPTLPDAPEQVAEESAPEAEQGIPDKFKDAETGEVDVEALLASYTALERKLSATSTPQEEESEEEGEEASPEGEEAEPEPEAEPAQNTIERFSQEYFETGELKEESFETLEGLGYPRDLVEAFISGQQALLTGEQDRLYAEVGGPEAYASMSEWASHNMTDQAKEAYNTAVQSGDYEQAALAVRGLRDTYIRAEGAQPNLVSGRNSAGPSLQPFRSTAELVAAMGDPRYSKDAAYRDDVESRLRSSNQL